MDILRGKTLAVLKYYNFLRVETFKFLPKLQKPQMLRGGGTRLYSTTSQTSLGVVLNKVA